ncbi:hypothetical protein XENOCAPTIV_022031, partial [Xenoophorus captivus]
QYLVAAPFAAICTVCGCVSVTPGHCTSSSPVRSREATESISTYCCPAPLITQFQVRHDENHGYSNVNSNQCTVATFLFSPTCVVCVKCDMLERLISPALIPLTPSLGVKTEGIRDFLPAVKGPSNQSPTQQRLKAIK